MGVQDQQSQLARSVDRGNGYIVVDVGFEEIQGRSGLSLVDSGAGQSQHGVCRRIEVGQGRVVGGGDEASGSDQAGQPIGSGHGCGLLRQVRLRSGGRGRNGCHHCGGAEQKGEGPRSGEPLQIGTVDGH
jgi:hypothetical protein